MSASSQTDRLLKLIAEHTGRSINDVPQHASLFDLGVTKDDLPQLCARVKAETGVELTIEDVLATQDVHELASMLKQPPKQPISGGGSVTKALKCMAMALLLPASSGYTFELNAEGCLTSFDANSDYFGPERRAMVASESTVPATVQFASDFSIEYAPPPRLTPSP